MKPTLVADEMFPEGAGPYVELEEVMLCMYSSNGGYEYICIDIVRFTSRCCFEAFFD